MQPLNNDHLIELYMDAVKMKLNDEFINILEKEIEKRKLLDIPEYKARFDNLIISSLISPYREKAAKLNSVST